MLGCRCSSPENSYAMLGTKASYTIQNGVIATNNLRVRSAEDRNVFELSHLVSGKGLD